MDMASAPEQPRERKAGDDRRREIADAALQAIARVGELLFEGFPPEHPDPLERLGDFYRRRMKVIRARPELVRLFASEELSHAAAEDGVRRLAEFRRRSSGF